MCGRTSLFVPQPALEDRFDATATTEIPPRYNIAPGDDLAAITNAAPDEITLLRWGFVPHWADDPNIGYRMINARAETVDEKPAYKAAFTDRRCLVLADGFYEWQGDRGSKQPYRITRADEEPFAMAGIWETWESNGRSLASVSIITTEANDVIAPIHDRMPVIFPPDDEDRWLKDTEPARLKRLLGPCSSELLAAYPVSTQVNDPANDTPEIITPRSDIQSDLGDYT